MTPSVVHDTPTDISSIFTDIQSDIWDLGLKWHTSTDILNSLQDVYNKIVADLTPIEHSTLIPQISEPYYDLRQIPDYMYVSGIFNPFTNLWLEGLTYKQMKATYQTYLAIGQPRWMGIVDLYRVLLWPYLPTASGVLYILYKGSAPQITTSHVPILPYSTGPKILEYLAVADLLKQNREFKKANLWLSRVFKPIPGSPLSLYSQCKKEIQDLARTDRENVLEPYRWIFHGGQFSVANWINDETPGGTQNGSNATFTLAQVPNPTTSLLLQKNGQNLIAGLGFTLSGQTITINSPFIPNATDSLNAWYQVS